MVRFSISSRAMVIINILFIILLFGALLSIVFGLPGTILIFVFSLIYALLTGFSLIGAKIILTLLGLALLAELLEFILGLAGAKRFGGSRKAMLGAIGGGITGAALGATYALGVGAIPGAIVGSFLGAFGLEFLTSRNLPQAYRVGLGALVGRAGGFIIKGTIGLVMIIIILIGIF